AGEPDQVGLARGGGLARQLLDEVPRGPRLVRVRLPLAAQEAGGVARAVLRPVADEPGVLQALDVFNERLDFLPLSGRRLPGGGGSAGGERECEAGGRRDEAWHDSPVILFY